ncbi:TPA: hypothetical protein U0688_001624 [Streptococcus suis]|uniref:Uncharacterized protein n=1 Tax=Streptococcus suis TaxID=1307 RepID=A0A0Z8BDR2_STRSU|nr:hypothetical protein [Streptococcus suis]ANM47334.1 hypothetical protein [Streptococcus phage phiZJ20091101-1]QBX21548.1 hypothetical protein Javan579_0012 [Streptococcus phage Javan579]AEB80908.1 phage protein [Streptococcus suis ST3]ALA28139.1 phage protein [Streptococcus suis]AMU79177.1 hypothetical protein AN924_06560 [Streptococcus suis]
MRILAIDPSSNRIETSTTGIVLLDNAGLVSYWVVPFGARNFSRWFREVGRDLEYDVVIVEEYQVRDNDYSRDNSVAETVEAVQACFPNVELVRNAGYVSDIPDQLLRKLGLWTFDKSHHQDVRAAARLALFWAQRKDIEEVIQDIGNRITQMAS